MNKSRWECLKLLITTAVPQAIGRSITLEDVVRAVEPCIGMGFEKNNYLFNIVDDWRKGLPLNGQSAELRGFILHILKNPINA